MSGPSMARRSLTCLLFLLGIVQVSACNPGLARDIGRKLVLRLYNARGDSQHEEIVAASSALRPLLARQEKIAFVSDRDGNDEIYIMNADGSNAINLTTDPANDRHPSWSPDGKSIAFASNRGDDIFDIYLLAIESGSLTRLTSRGSNTRPAWSPDGRRIAFVSDRYGDKDVMVMNADGSRQIQLTVDVYHDDHPTWSPDGASIAYVSDVDGPRGIIVISSLDGSELKSLSIDTADDFEPNWLQSETDSQLLFTSVRSENQDIFVIDPITGKGLRQITSDSSDEWQPSWSPDGATITFVSDRENDGETNIYAMRADGSSVKRLTPLGSNDRDPEWR